MYARTSIRPLLTLKKLGGFGTPRVFLLEVEIAEAPPPFGKYSVLCLSSDDTTGGLLTRYVCMYARTYVCVYFITDYMYNRATSAPFELDRDDNIDSAIYIKYHRAVRYIYGGRGVEEAT